VSGRFYGASLGVTPYIRIHADDNRLVFAMRYRKKQDDYYRDAGHWDIKYQWFKDTLCAFATYPAVEHLNEFAMIEITREEWREDNRGYI